MPMAKLLLSPALSDGAAKESFSLHGSNPPAAFRGQHIHSLAGCVQQLADLSAHASILFEGLFHEADALDKRIKGFRRRVTTAEDMLPAVEQKCSTSLAKFQWEPTSAWRSNMSQDAMLFSKSRTDPTVKREYIKAQPPPDLAAFDVFKEPDRPPSMKFYSDLDFFFERWLLLQEEQQRQNREKRRRKKKSRARQGTTTRRVRQVKVKKFDSLTGEEIQEDDSKYRKPTEAGAAPSSVAAPGVTPSKPKGTPPVKPMSKPPPPPSKPMGAPPPPPSKPTVAPPAPPMPAAAHPNTMPPPPPPSAKSKPTLVEDESPPPPMPSDAPPPPPAVSSKPGVSAPPTGALPPPPPPMPAALSSAGAAVPPPPGPPPMTMGGGPPPPPPDLRPPSAPPAPPMPAGGLGDALKAVVLKSNTQAHGQGTVASGQDLLAQIRDGKKLRPVKREDEDARRNTYDPKDKSVQAILMRRFALEMSDDEDGSDDGGSSDGWSD